MNSTPNALPFKRGDFIWCVQIHEDELQAIPERQGEMRKKKNGSLERVDAYEVYGKRRPALVLLAKDGYRDVIVWYTRTACESKPEWIDVTSITRPGPPKKAYLAPQPHLIRRVPFTETWCGERIDTPDRTVFDSWSLKATKLFMRL